MVGRPTGDSAADEAIAEAAADWIVRLSADEPDERDQARRAFEAWKLADPAHAAAAASMERFVDAALSLHGGPAQEGGGQRRYGGSEPARTASRPARNALVGHFGAEVPAEGGGGGGADGADGEKGDAGAAGRRGRAAADSASRRKGRIKGRAGVRIGAGLTGLVLIVGLALAVAMGQGQVSGVGLGLGPSTVAAWFADHRTRVGEQRTEILADGSRLVLGGASAIDVRFGAVRREVELLQGEILVDVAGDPARPFAVASPAGTVVALGTRFLVRREAGATEITMLESRAAVHRAGARDPDLVLEPGQRVRLDAGGSWRLADVDPTVIDQAFRRRRLVVQDQPLAAVLDRLAAERRGLLRQDLGRLADLRVTAVLPLDDTDQALQLLNESFPQIRIRRVGGWIVLVDRQP